MKNIIFYQTIINKIIISLQKINIMNYCLSSQREINLHKMTQIRQTYVLYVLLIVHIKKSCASRRKRQPNNEK